MPLQRIARAGLSPNTGPGAIPRGSCSITRAKEPAIPPLRDGTPEGASCAGGGRCDPRLVGSTRRTRHGGGSGDLAGHEACASDQRRGGQRPTVPSQRHRGSVVGDPLDATGVAAAGHRVGGSSCRRDVVTAALRTADLGDITVQTRTVRKCRSRRFDRAGSAGPYVLVAERQVIQQPSACAPNAIDGERVDR